MYSKGQTLIEVLIAFGIATVLVSAIASTVLFALSNAQLSKNQSLATQYSQQGIEIVRKMQKEGTQFPNSTKCLNIGDVSFTDLPAGGQCPQVQGFPFLRQVQFSTDSSCGQQTQRIILTTLWSDNTCLVGGKGNTYCHQAVISSCLSDLNKVPTPGSANVSPTPSPTPYPVPTLVSVAYQSPGVVRITWTAALGAIGYNIYGCGGFNCVLSSSPWFSNVSGSTQDQNLGTPTCDTSYYSYGVKAIFPDSSMSSMSNIISNFAWVVDCGGPD